MILKTTLKAMALTSGLLLLSACSTTSTPSAEKVAEAKTAKEVSENLTQTRTTAKSADGKMVCKRTTVVGSNFKRKVCATQEEWDARAEADRKTTDGIQRSKGPGVSN